MMIVRTLAIAAFALVVLAGATEPAGSSVSSAGCGPAVTIRDPILRASFTHFDRNQTSAAARLCASYRNEMGRADF